MATIGQSAKNLAELANDNYYDDRIFKRGEIYYLDLEDIGYGSKYVQTKTRPALIIQNDVGNVHSGTLIVALLTTSFKKSYPFQYLFKLNDRESVIMFEQIMTVDKFRMLEKIGELTPKQIKESDEKLMYSLQLNRLSLDNILDFDVLGVVSEKTRTGELCYFKIEISFENYQKTLIHIDLKKIQEFNSSISKDIDFDELKKLLDCCKGLHWIAKNNMI